MKSSHQGLGISDDDWQVAVKLLVATLDKFNVGARERTDLFAALSGLKADIVEQ